MSHQTRREFLSDSVLAAAVAAVAGVSPGPRTFAAEGSSSPSERLRVAVIGVGGRGGAHISEFTRLKDTEVVALCDADENKGGKRIEALKKSTRKDVKFFKDMRDLLDDKSIDAVSIATPNHWHSLAAIWAVQAGKDVYVEKPVSHNPSEGRRVVQAARKYNKIVQTGTQGRSMQAQIDAIEFVKSGGIGDVKLARGLCYKRRGSIGKKGNYDVPAGVDYNLWLGPAPMKPLTRPRLHYDWHWIWDTGNGDLGNQGIHQMDICRWGLGVDNLGKSVVSYGGRLGYEDAGETANSQVSIHDYGDKKLVFEVRGLKTDPLRGAKVGVIFYGTEGYVVSTSNYKVAWAFDREGNKIKEFKGLGDHFGNFVAAVRSRKKEDLTADILKGHLSSALCHLGNISYRLGEKVTAKEAEKRLGGSDEAVRTFGRFAEHLTANEIDLEKTKIQFGRQLTLNSGEEVFTGAGAAAANPMLTRNYRKPFVVPAEKDV